MKKRFPSPVDSITGESAVRAQRKRKKEQKKGRLLISHNLGRKIGAATFPGPVVRRGKGGRPRTSFAHVSGLRKKRKKAASEEKN